MLKILPIILILLLSQIIGCASTSEVIPYGNNTYIVTVDDAWGELSAGSLTVKAAKEANAFCSKKGKTMDVVTKQEMHGKPTSSTLTFNCN
jgi:hypothetical protein